MAVTDTTASIIDIVIRYEDEGSTATAAVKKTERQHPLQANITPLHLETSEVNITQLGLYSH
jgi:hypothetical protein